MGIRASLALAAVAALVPWIGLSAWQLQHAHDTAVDAQLREAMTAARGLSRALDAELTTAEATLRVLATSPHLASGDLSAFRGQAIAARLPAGTSIRLVCSAGLLASESIVDVRTGMQPDPGRERTPAHASAGADAGGTHRPPRASADRTVVTLAVPIPTSEESCHLAHSLDGDAIRRVLSERNERIDAGMAAIPDGWQVNVYDQHLAPIASIGPGRDGGAREAPEDLRRESLRSAEGHVHSYAVGMPPRQEVFTRSLRTGWIVDVAVPLNAGPAIDIDHRRRVIAIMVLVTASTAMLMLLLGRRIHASLASLLGTAQALARSGSLPPHVASVREIDEVHAALGQTYASLEEERAARTGVRSEYELELETARAARDSAEAQNRAKDEFVAMLGHELRNPLSAIAGAVALLHPETEDARQAQAVLERQTRHLAGIVDDLVDLGRLMAGRTRLDTRAVDLALLCANALATMRTGMPGDTHPVTVRMQPAMVKVDANRMEQAICILLRSVLEHASHDSHIELALAPASDAAVLTVKDAGLALPRQLVGDDPGRSHAKSDPALDPARSGPSIRLGIVEHLVRLHGGSMQTSRRPDGRGGSYTIHLPLDRDLSPQATESGTTPAVHLRVLVVDDHDDSRTMLRLLLQQSGHQAAEAIDGIDGVQLALTLRPDVAIVDIGLPGIDGYEVARRLRKLPHGRRMGLVALTGYGQTEDRERALRAGFDRHLVKPVDAVKLQAALAELAMTSHAQADTSAPAPDAGRAQE